MSQKQILTKLSKWGNGYAIRLPAKFLSRADISEDNQIILEQHKRSIKIIRKDPLILNMSLSQILKGITPNIIKDKSVDNMFGCPKGKEIW